MFSDGHCFKPEDSIKGVSLVESGRNNEARIPLFKYELTLGITNQNYTDSLLNTLSVDYLILSLEVKGAVSFTLWFWIWLKSLRKKKQRKLEPMNWI